MKKAKEPTLLDGNQPIFYERVVDIVREFLEQEVDPERCMRKITIAVIGHKAQHSVTIKLGAEDMESARSVISGKAKADPAWSDDVATAIRGDYLLNTLSRAIGDAEHKPDQWHNTLASMGGICTHSSDIDPFSNTEEKRWAHFDYKRDAWLAVVAVNALPELIERVARLMIAERAQDAEIERLRAKLNACKAELLDAEAAAERSWKIIANGSDLPIAGAPPWATVLIASLHGTGPLAWASGFETGAEYLWVKATEGSDSETLDLAPGHGWKLISKRP